MSDKDSGALAANGGSNSDLERFKLSLTVDDFRSIDADSNNRLTLLELSNAAKDGKFSGEKLKAVEGLRDELRKSPAQAVDKDHDIEKIIPTWHTVEFAMNQLSRDDFTRIDSDHDNMMSKDELKAAASNKDLAAMSKHAAQVLLREATANGFDNRNVIHNKFVMNWHDLDSEFKDVPTDRLVNFISSSESSKAAKAGAELVKRLDYAMTPSEVNDAMQSIPLIEEALKTNKDIEFNSDHKVVLKDKPLTDERRRQMHAAVLGDFASINGQIDVRTGMASVYEQLGFHKEAQKWRADAVDRSDLLMKKVKTDKGEMRLIDLMKTEANQLVLDSKGNGGNEYVNASDQLNEMIRSPIETRLNDAHSSLGMTFSGNEDRSVKVSINTDDALFNPNRAEQRSKEARNLSMDILGIDPAKSADRRASSLFGANWKEFDPKGNYDFYRDANNNGNVDMLDALRDMKTYNDSWRGTVFGRKTGF